MRIAVVGDTGNAVDAGLARLGHVVDVEPVPGPDDEVVGRLVGRWRAERPHVVHARGAAAGVPALLAARQSGLAVVLSFGGIAVGTGSGDAERARAERLTAREAAHVIAVSADQRSELVRWGVARSAVSVVPMAVDTEAFRPCGPVVPRDWPFRLVVVGGARPDHGFQDVVTALRSLAGAELVVVAHPGDLDAGRLTAHARVCGVEDRVRFDAATDLPALLRSADVVVCPGRHEPDPTTALRAMACGTPVVAAAAGVLPETVVDGVTGRLVPPRDVTALARVLRELLSAGGLPAGYGRAAADWVRLRYAVDRVAAETAKVFEAVVPSAVR